MLLHSSLPLCRWRQIYLAHVCRSHGRNKGSAPRQIGRTDVAATAHTSSVQKKQIRRVPGDRRRRRNRRPLGIPLSLPSVAAVCGKCAQTKSPHPHFGGRGLAQPSWYHHHSPLMPTHQEPHSISPPCRICDATFKRNRRALTGASRCRLQSVPGWGRGSPDGSGASCRKVGRRRSQHARRSLPRPSHNRPIPITACAILYLLHTLA